MKRLGNPTQLEADFTFIGLSTDPTSPGVYQIVRGYDNGNRTVDQPPYIGCFDTLVITDVEGPSPGFTPEPSTITLFGIGIVGMAGFGWRRRKQSVNS